MKDYDSDNDIGNEKCLNLSVGYFTDSELAKRRTRRVSANRHQLQQRRLKRLREAKAASPAVNSKKARYLLEEKPSTSNSTTTHAYSRSGVWDTSLPLPAIKMEQIPDKRPGKGNTYPNQPKPLPYTPFGDLAGMDMQTFPKVTQTAIMRDETAIMRNEPAITRNETATTKDQPSKVTSKVASQGSIMIPISSRDGSSEQLLPPSNNYIDCEQPERTPENDEVSQTRKIEDILGKEQKQRSIEHTTAKDMFHDALEEFKSSNQEVVKCDSAKGKSSFRILRVTNFVRALVTSCYGIYAISQIMYRQVYIDLGAQPYCIASLVFLSLDLMFAFMKAFPRVFWCFWDVDSWDPFLKTFSIWNLVADHEMILDSIPLMANVVLKVYGFRLSELVAQISQEEAERTGVFGLKQVTINEVLLYVFAITLCLTLLTHTLRLCGTLMAKKKAYSLSIVIFIKVLMLMFDLFTNAVLLYYTLAFENIHMFEVSLIPSLVISVFVASPAVGLTTNFLLNYPLHIAHIRMSLKSINALRNISFARISHSAFKKTFNPFIQAIFGTYACYSLCALSYVLYMIYHVSYEDIWNIPGTMFTNESVIDVLLSLLWLNIVLNYLCGIVSAITYWLVQIFLMFKSVWIFRVICCCNSEVV